MDTILGILLSESDSGIRALVNLFVCVNLYPQPSGTIVGETVAELTTSLA